MANARLLLVEDDALYRQTVAQELRAAGYEVVEANSAAQANALTTGSIFTFTGCLVDLRLKPSSGLEVLSALRRRSSAVMLAALTAHCTDDDVFGALEAGADAYLLKSDPIDELPGRVGDLLKGLSPLSPGIARRLIAHFAQRPKISNDFKLSTRELELLHLLAGGFTFSQCAAGMSIGTETVKTMTKRIREKLQVGSVTEAISVGFRSGLLQ